MHEPQPVSAVDLPSLANQYVVVQTHKRPERCPAAYKLRSRKILPIARIQALAALAVHERSFTTAMAHRHVLATRPRVVSMALQLLGHLVHHLLDLAFLPLGFYRLHKIFHGWLRAWPQKTSALSRRKGNRNRERRAGQDCCPDHE
jgi:hypothetical protein